MTGRFTVESCGQHRDGLYIITFKDALRVLRFATSTVPIAERKSIAILDGKVVDEGHRMSGAMNPTGAGDFATSRRGGLTREEIREIEAHRGRLRPTPWQALSERYGRSVCDLKALFAVPEVAVSPPEAWPFGACSFAIQEALRSVAEMHGCTLAEALTERTPGKAGSRARRQMYLVARAMGLTLDDLCGIFGRDRKLIYEAIQADTRRVGPAETGLQHVRIPLARVMAGIAVKVEARG